jgi:hypothetical protein
MPKTVRLPRVAGIDLNVVKADVLSASLLRANLSTEGGLPIRALRLFQHVRDTVSQDNRAPCATCGGDGDTRLNHCAYCGDGWEDEGVAIARAIAEPFRRLSHSMIPEDESEQKATELISVGAPPSSAELDAALCKVRLHERTAMGSTWDLGTALLAIYDPGLYRARHDTWELFCYLELGLLARSTYRLMAIARVFDRGTVEELGPSRLTMALRCPPERRDELLAKVRAGLGVAGLRAEIASMRLLDHTPSEKLEPEEQPTRTLTVPAGVTTIPLEILQVDRTNKRLPLALGELSANGCHVSFRIMRKATDGSFALVLETKGRSNESQ